MTITKDTREYVAVKIETKNDVNGNPRRAWLLIDHNGTVALVAPENYRGERGALKDATAALSLVGYDRRDRRHNGIVDPTFDDHGNLYCEGPHVVAIVYPSVCLAVTPGQYRASLRDNDTV